MASKMQGVLDGLKESLGSPSAERPSKSLKCDVPVGPPVDMGELAVYLKKELGEMIDNKLGVGMKEMKSQLHDVAVATSEGFKEVECAFAKEKKESKEWQDNMKGKLEEATLKANEALDKANDMMRGSGAGKGTGKAAPRMEARSGGNAHWVAGNVEVFGFFEYASKTGALGTVERDKLAADLLEHVPENVQHGFKLNTRFNLTRKLIFSKAGGGEDCWSLREALMNAIETHGIKCNDKDLKVRVEDSPQKRNKRAKFFRAADVLREIEGAVDKIILEPQTCGIHSKETHQLLGKATEDHFEWNEEVVTSVFPGIDMPKLRRDCGKRSE